MSNSRKKAVKPDERFDAMIESLAEDMRKHTLVVSKQIAEKLIEMYYPTCTDMVFNIDEHRDFVRQIATFVKHCVHVGEGITISEARGALIGIACRYERFKSPREDELRRQAIILAKLILDCIDSEHSRSMIEVASIFKDDVDIDLPF